ncbi:carboxymuconolactone decarboxylase family protein [Pelagibacterium luteolum]|uniref:Alkylhydroperoxidase AhpD family core domain-containing protein n=1 Tax=Pelagibacterium luteolum TaxID=440168 RepID=A0A1G7YWZ4_9HYPH|nr:carboxymuconolactone decarboxylase family protein [Pelagibacterium luteolum]SDH01033.1 alkylhydroperoxidase AhpD family core domain-containing protein [Pelagibacterium luteolum]
MQPRIEAFSVEPKLMQSLLKLEETITASGLEQSLIELVKIRASQINACAYCLHMHTADALAQGERVERLLLLDAWQESTLFTAREKAALGWVEALTNVGATHAPDEDFDALKPAFSESEIVKLTLLIGMINLWNRVCVGLRAVHPADIEGAEDKRRQL